MNITSIFDIPVYVGGNTYNIGDIVLHNGFYRYCTTQTSAASFNAAHWNGTIVHNGETKPYFFWTESYSSPVENEPSIRKIQFDDAYAQSSPNGINNLLLNLNLNFNDRKATEAAGILHFLKQRAGTESFVFTPQFPYGKAKRFVCEKWNSNFIFKDNYQINCIFTERAI